MDFRLSEASGHDKKTGVHVHKHQAICDLDIPNSAHNLHAYLNLSLHHSLHVYTYKELTTTFILIRTPQHIST